MELTADVVFGLGFGLLLVLVSISAWMLWMLSTRLQRLNDRYDQFRGEVAETMAQAFEQIADVNRRLSLAGYPPGRKLPDALPEPKQAWFPPPDPNRR